MRKLLIIGIGSGNPEHMTVQAINALNRADVLFIPTKGEKKTELAEVRREICARYVTRADSRTVEFAVPVRRTEGVSYDGSVDDWHARIAEIYERLIDGELTEDGTGAFLVWGDPMLYDSTIRIVERVKARGKVAFDYDVLPGITSLQALCASHRIPLNLVGKPVEITTGRRLSESFPKRSQTSVVMLDGEQAFQRIDDPDAEIYWGAYLGTPDEIVISGRLADVKDEILATRARERQRMGWIMDIYLLRKGADFEE
ncbi:MULTISPECIES: precorrin-6A synthase (deacetylating) [Ensifer]|uniref:Precorrin-6A synthase [deacetylating] n=1 Tax=Ensifer canadensis TaxID=555315 RepID=A0AAW4FTY1_9HYPH|nr:MULTISPECIES: precorrin-6A synthase (deacetylating) [Ensifer]AHK42513.1 deacetylating precorrin-6A synthase CobF [Ensifer adhaerens OV14]KQU82170.1 precorrin 6A synthase [Ensifer sp. Root31]KQW55484.1 precorrin 6A synthase [Ensifer sp. Root1252]KQW73612.1 precorrin 6A synthase [Ensifer sp. Root127]KQY69753.1 precorrin 6A synthase [Ensifer sp. Root142]